MIKTIIAAERLAEIFLIKVICNLNEVGNIFYDLSKIMLTAILDFNLSTA